MLFHSSYQKLAEQLFEKYTMLKALKMGLTPQTTNIIHSKINQEGRSIDELIKKANSIHMNKHCDQPFSHYLILTRLYDFDFLKSLHIMRLQFNLTNNKHESALAIASQYDDLQLVKYLVEDVKIKIGVSEPEHPYAIALKNRNKAVADYLLEKLSVYSKGGDSPLTMACRYGYTPLVKRFLEHPEMCGPAHDGSTPLMHAAYYGKHVNVIIPLLLKHNPDFLGKAERDMTVLHMIFQSPHPGVVDSFFASSPEFLDYLYNNTGEPCILGHFPIHYAIQYGHVKWVNVILKNNPGLANHRNPNGGGLLIYAVAYDHLQLVCDLHEIHHLSLTDVHENKQTLLEYCAVYDRVDIANYLKEKQAIDENQTGQLPTNALRLAIQQKSLGMIEWFLSQETLDLSIIYPPSPTHSHNIAHMLCEFGLFEYIIKFDLFRKDINLLLFKNNHNQSCLGKLIHAGQNDPAYQERCKEFFRYTLTVLREKSPHHRLSLDYFSEFLQIVFFCLKQKLIDANELFGEQAEPLFHVWERFLYNKTIASKLTDTNNEEEQAGLRLDFYQLHIILILEYTPDLGLRDGQNLSILAKLIKTGPNSFSRIKWLGEHLRGVKDLNGIKLTELDERGSSLLHLACEEQHFELVRWSERKLSITKPRLDGMNALDCAIKSRNVSISTFLVHKLSCQEWQTYLETASDDIIIKIIQDNFYNRIPQTFSKKMLKNPLFAEYKATTSRRLSVDSRDLTLKTDPADKQQDIDNESPHLIPDWDLLTTAIQQNQVGVIRTLQHEQYQSSLKTIIADRVCELILLAATQDKSRLLRRFLAIPAIKDLVIPCLTTILSQILVQDSHACSVLMQQPAIIKALGSNHYQAVREAIDSKSDLVDMMLKLPDIKAFVQDQYPQLSGNTQATEEVSGSMEQSGDMVAPVFFYNSEYYMHISTTDDFFDAIANHDLTTLYTLFMNSGDLHPGFICDLASFAVTHGDIDVFNMLLELAYPVIAMQAEFCNKLICNAMWAEKEAIVNRLFYLESIQRNPALFDNRLLRTAVRCGFPTIALALLTSPDVCKNAAAMDNHALRWAIRYQENKLIMHLWSIDTVRQNAGVFNHQPLKLALQNHNDYVVHLILQEPGELDYVYKQADEGEPLYKNLVYKLRLSNTGLLSSLSLFQPVTCQNVSPKVEYNRPEI